MGWIGKYPFLFGERKRLFLVMEENIYGDLRSKLIHWAETTEAPQPRELPTKSTIPTPTAPVTRRPSPQKEESASSQNNNHFPSGAVVGRFSGLFRDDDQSLNRRPTLNQYPSYTYNVKSFVRSTTTESELLNHKPDNKTLQPVSILSNTTFQKELDAHEFTLRALQRDVDGEGQIVEGISSHHGSDVVMALMEVLGRLSSIRLKFESISSWRRGRKIAISKGTLSVSDTQESLLHHLEAICRAVKDSIDTVEQRTNDLLLR
eukprot:PhF_6_TR31790/c0_g1_i1/m.46831